MNSLSNRTRNSLGQLFYFFGLGMMVTAARTPEIKSNLSLTNATFGTFLSLGLIGSMAALLWMGEVVHKVGVKKVMIAATTLLYAGLALVPHLHNGYIWLALNVLLGFSISTFHIAINGQAIHIQEKYSVLLIPKLHGLWMAGSLSTAVIALLITSRVPLAWHIDVLVSLVWLLTIRAINRLGEDILGPTPELENERSGALNAIKQIPQALKWGPWIAFGMLMAAQIEMAANDWTTIFVKEELGTSATVAILPYIAFMLSMISIRFTIHRLLTKRSERYWLRRIPVAGGIGFIIFLQIAVRVSGSHPHAGVLFGVLAFIAAGLGCSFIVPGFFAISARLSPLPGSVIIAQMSLINVALTFLGKMVIAWIAGATSIGTALLIPGVMLIATAFSAHLGSAEKSKAV